MNKTIYIRDKDEPIWERARELAGAEGISSIVVESLKKFVAHKEAEEAVAKGFERIVVKFNDASAHHIPRIKAFYGKWIIPIAEPLKVCTEDGDTSWWYSVAVTAKGSAVVFWIEQDANGQAQYFRVYPSLELAAADPDVNCAVTKAIRLLGVPVEELDI
ncbi:MAG: hypothetical protein ACLQKA_05375 [Bryobacteraceae bacterium]